MLMLGMDGRAMDGIIALISLIYSGLSVYLLKNNIDLRYNSEQDWDSWRTELKLIAVLGLILAVYTFYALLR